MGPSPRLPVALCDRIRPGHVAAPGATV